MKSIFNKIILLSVLALAFTSCESFKDKEIVNGVIIDGLALDKIEIITVEEDGYIYELTPRLTVAQDEDIVIRVAVDEDYLTTYNNDQLKSFLLLPDERYLFLNDSVRIIAGSLEPTKTIQIQVQSLSDIVDEGNYMLPLAITSNSKDADVVAGYDKVLLRVISPLRINYPVISSGTETISAVIGGDDVDPFFSDSLTIEMNIAGEEMQKTTGSAGEYMFYIATLKLNLRHGDKAYTAQQTNLGLYGATYTVEDEQYYFPDNEWVHLAITYTSGDCNIYRNGVLLSTLAPVKTFDLQKFTVYIGPNAYNYNGRRAMSELRVWSCMRTQQEIIDNRWFIPATTDKLEFYWKLNEGEGLTFYESAKKHSYLDENGETKYYDVEAAYAFEWKTNTAVEEEAPIL